MGELVIDDKRTMNKLALLFVISKVVGGGDDGRPSWNGALHQGEHPLYALSDVDEHQLASSDVVSLRQRQECAS